MTGKAPLIVAAHLRKSYSSFTAVADLSLKLAPGEIHGLLGPNGAGKTTTVRMLTGSLRPTSGSVAIAGEDLWAGDGRKAKSLIGYVPDEPYLYGRLTGRENVELMARLWGMGTERRPLTQSLLDALDLTNAADDQMLTYSHGMRQKTALAGALIHDPLVLFLDEPTVGLDPRSARQLRYTLRDLAEAGGAVMLSTHILEIAQSLCDRVTILNHGQMLATGSMEELRRQTRAGADESLEDLFMRLTGEGDDGTIVPALGGTGPSERHPKS